MTHPNLNKVKKIMAERKEELAERSLDKDPAKRGLEKTMREVAKVVKKEGLE